MLLYIIAYDIPCNKRRKKVSDLLEGYGTRVQYSVFECILSNKKYCELKRRLLKRVNVNEDHLRFYPLSKHTLETIEVWGGSPVINQATSTII
ncbi:CRISPR-associated endonuclease Cas2 [Synechococcus sp. PCC 6312]|uniref:CRISPR-associated endonuclease Cas2 n=1 Tax=Synechococcus sp. (strain ATCC 27167 / PCC 6312) TaxID=195253 RepID=UPI00029F218C|nr:CRISPR-associated endonuclease Cas2 [Synechococcus sp. PCC 6312]AFY61925.1 CRISPR-associated protein, Cas2 family [Synechococcus sp. PCC 6312]